MIHDAATEPAPATLRADVAVVGAGPAGISLALALADRGVEVVVLESGGPGIDEQATDLLQVEQSGEPDYPASATRVRALGGTTEAWGGHCHPLEPADFEARSWVPASGWPFGPDELAPWYPRAQALVEVGQDPFDVDAWRPRLDAEGLPLVETDHVRTGLFRLSPPTKFGRRYRDDLESAQLVTAWLHVTVVNVVTGPDGAVSSLDAVTPHGRVVVEADQYVLAGGGIEVARLLLASQDAGPAGVGNDHDLVGRYFMEHPHLEAGAAVLNPGLGNELSSGLLFGIGVPVGESAPLLAHLMLRPDVVADEELLAVAITLVGADEGTPRMGALRALLDDLEDAETWTRTLFLRGEQTPDPDNRVTLGTELDPLGMPRAHLHWSVSASDRARYARAVELVAADLLAADLGRVRTGLGDPERFPSIGGGHHHMGTTRMHEDPTGGVVDPDCRVYGVANLHVASSAVFPTSGVVNPTLTIVALALRLADHLTVSAP